MQNITTDYQSMTNSQALDYRESLMEDLYFQVERLSKKFKKKSSSVNDYIERINDLLENLSEINYQIEVKKRENTNNQEKSTKSCGLKKIPKAVWISLSLEFLAVLGMTGVQILNFISTKNLDNQLEIVQNNCSATISSNTSSSIKTYNNISLFLTVLISVIILPTASCITKIDDEKDRQDISDGVLAIKDQNKELLEFFKSLQNFKQSVNSRDNDSQSELDLSFADCIHHLDAAPSCELKNMIPSRDHWISLMLNLLPEEHSVKTQLNEIYEGVAEIIQDHSSSICHSEDSNSFTANASESNESSSKLRGEQLSKPNRMTAKIVDNQSQQVLNIKKHKNLWNTIESKIGLKVKRIQLAEHLAVDRNGYIANHISELESYSSNPFSKFQSSSFSGTNSYTEV